MKLELEINEQLGAVLNKASESVFKTGEGKPAIMVTPDIGEDYWIFRVKVSEKQAIIGFPKFFTCGVGFAVEEDWNTNLPYTSKSDLYNHIAVNRKAAGDNPSVADCKKAIEMVCDAAKKYKEAWENM